MSAVKSVSPRTIAWAALAIGGVGLGIGLPGEAFLR